MGKGCLACPYGYSVGEEWFQHGLNNNHCLLVGAMSSTMCIPHCEKSFRFVQKLCLFLECLICGLCNKGLSCILTWRRGLNNNHCLLVGAMISNICAPHFESCSYLFKTSIFTDQIQMRNEKNFWYFGWDEPSIKQSSLKSAMFWWWIKNNGELRH